MSHKKKSKNKCCQPMTKAEIRKHFKIIGALLVVLFTLSGVFIWQTSVFKMHNISMSPTLEEGQLVFVNRFAKNFEAGDVIAYTHREPDDDPEKIPEIKIQRLIALSGEGIGVKDGFLYHNQEKVLEIYTEEGQEFDPDTKLTEYDIPNDTYFVYGDNKNYKRGRADNPFVYKDTVIGKVIGY